MPNQYEDKDARVEIAICKPDYCPHGADLRIAVCHRCDGTALYTEQDLAQKQLEARIDELKHLGFDKRLENPILSCYNADPFGAITLDERIAELTKQEGKG